MPGSNIQERGSGRVYDPGQVYDPGRTQLLQSGTLTRKAGGPMARSTGSGRLARRRGCPSGSSPPATSTQPHPYTNIHGYLRKIIEAFGPERQSTGPSSNKSVIRGSWS